MSLAIDVSTVTAVLLADGWHEVDDRSFAIDSYEFEWSRRPGVFVIDLDNLPDTDDGSREPMTVHGAGSAGITAAGFIFLDTDQAGYVAGPLTAVLAVRFVP